MIECFIYVILSWFVSLCLISVGMNVVMPIAASSMHTESALATASQKTAERGIRVLNMLLDNPTTKRQCVAIYAATSGKHGKADADLVKVRINSASAP